MMSAAAFAAAALVSAGGLDGHMHSTYMQASHHLVGSKPTLCNHKKTDTENKKHWD
jgi:hypothetical protein